MAKKGLLVTLEKTVNGFLSDFFIFVGAGDSILTHDPLITKFQARKMLAPVLVPILFLIIASLHIKGFLVWFDPSLGYCRSTKNAAL